MDEFLVLKNLNKPINLKVETDTIMMQYLKTILMVKVTAKIGHHGATDGRRNNGVSGSRRQRTKKLMKKSLMRNYVGMSWRWRRSRCSPTSC